jgi:hypothetical protein
MLLSAIRCVGEVSWDLMCQGMIKEKGKVRSIAAIGELRFSLKGMDLMPKSGVYPMV